MFSEPQLIARLWCAKSFDSNESLQNLFHFKFDIFLK